MREQNKRARRDQEDAIFNRMLIWLAGCAVLEAVTLLFRQLYFNYPLGLVKFVYALSSFFVLFRFVGIALSVAALAWTAISVRGGAKGRQLVPQLVCTGVVVWLTLVSILCADYGFCQEIGMALLCAVPAVIAGLAIVFFLYQREFFYQSVLCAAGITAIWVYRSIYTNHPTMTYAGFAVVWLLMAAAAVLAYMAKKKDGMLKDLRVLPPDSSYTLTWLTCAVTALLLAVTLLVGVAYAYYVMYVLIGWLFCLAVYYTVKLM